MEFDFGKLKCKVNTVPLDSNVATHFPELATHFREYASAIEELGIPLDKMIRFAVLCYSETSPLVTMIDDLSMRKKKALELIEFDHEELSSPINNSVIAHAVIQFLKFENHSRHMNLMMYHESMGKCHADLLLTKGATRKQTLEAMEKLQNMIDKLSATHFKDDEELDNYSDSFQIQEKRKIFPEEQ